MPELLHEHEHEHNHVLLTNTGVSPGWYDAGVSLSSLDYFVSCYTSLGYDRSLPRVIINSIVEVIVMPGKYSSQSGIYMVIIQVAI